ncbi:hypothetical protein KJK32_44175 [Streptomyces sp. JCM17656]|nr:hypothetical protein KJK32_44175 [Streptomyces sp. JCM17656]
MIEPRLSAYHLGVVSPSTMCGTAQHFLHEEWNRGQPRLGGARRVVEDRNLSTGQKQASASVLGGRLLMLLKQR